MLATVCAGASALAADLPLKPPPPLPPAPSVYRWSGFYLGGTAGGAWGTLDPRTSTSLTGAYFPDSAVVDTVNAAGVQGGTLASVPLGLEAGYNWQPAGARWLLGVEADVQSLRLSAGTQTGPLVYPGFAPTTFSIGSAVSANWLATLRPRVGWTADNWLFYVTGGLALTRLDGVFGFADGFGGVESGFFSTLRAGYTAGGGIEVGLGDHWSAKAEYLFAGIPSVSMTSGNLIALATPIAGQPFVHSADLKVNIARFGLNYRFDQAGEGANQSGGYLLPVKAHIAPPMLWTWAGFYYGVHVGGGLGLTRFDDPFGATIFGDTVRAPAFLGGGQIGYAWQAPASRWVAGVEADVSLINGDGTVTCFAGFAQDFNATCESRPRFSGTLTGRLGYALGDLGHTLVYARGGLAVARDRIDMAQNFGGVPGFTTYDTQSPLFWGGTAGFGVEQAITPAWSVSLEYDYLGFAGRSIANVGTTTCVPVAGGCVITAVTPPGISGVTFNLQQLKAGLNYRFGADPSAHWSDPRPGTAVPAAGWQGWQGWQVEGGGRYFASWGQFHKDLGLGIPSGLPSISSVSRLTYDDLQTNAGEYFMRLDMPWRIFVKGYVGGGLSDRAHLNDEDFLVGLGGGAFPYSNTLSASVTGKIGYGAVDAGFDFLKGGGYKVGVYAGYFQLHQFMSAFGCTPVAGINCIPPIPVAGGAAITENDTWRALRVGVASDAMLTDRLKLGADVAYLPYLRFGGVDQHFFGNSGVLASDNPESGKGQGVQAEAVLSYYVTPQFSLGVGARYWGLWTTSAQVFRDYDATGALVTPTSPQYFKATAEQAGAFVQASYRFGH